MLNPWSKLISPNPPNIIQHSKSSFIILISSCTPTVPDRVPNLAVQPSKPNFDRISLTVTWDEPHSDVNITRYQSNYGIQSTRDWKDGSSQPATNRQRVFRYLKSGLDYEVRVRAVSAIGHGEYRTATTSCMSLAECVL